MDWLSLPVNVLLGPEHLRVSKNVRATWVTLLAHCAFRENGGVIQGAADWSPRDWDRLAGTTRREVEALITSELARWEGPDLAVAHYPVKPQEVLRRKREGGEEGGKRSGESRKSFKSGASTPSKQPAKESRRTPSNGEESVGEESVGEESVDDRAPDGSQEARDLASYLADAIRSHSPDAKLHPDRWVHDIDLALRLDKRIPQALKRAIDWAHRSSDTFWQPNIRSGEKLREKFAMLTAQADRAGFQTLAVVRRDPKPSNGSPRGSMSDAELRALEQAAAEYGLDRGSK